MPGRKRGSAGAASKAGRLNVKFSARLERNATPGGWTYVVWPSASKAFGTRGLVKVEGTMDGVPFRSAFMAMGDGRQMLPVRKALQRQMDKQAGDRVNVELHRRLR